MIQDSKKDRWVEKEYSIIKSILDQHRKTKLCYRQTKLPIIASYEAILGTDLSSNLATINEVLTKAANHIDPH